MSSRKRKPFNPMLGETFELVMDDFRFLAEKTCHVPIQTLCFFLEGENYRLWGNQTPQPAFKFNGGKGML